MREGESPTSLSVTDADMAEEDANEAVSIHSSSSKSPTIPSTEHPEEVDAQMADDASATTSSVEEEGDCLSNRPAFPDACPTNDEMLDAEDDAGSVLPPQDVDPQIAAPHHNHLSPQSKEDRGPRPVPGELNPRSYGNRLLRHPGSYSAAFLNMSNHRPH